MTSLSSYPHRSFVLFFLKLVLSVILLIIAFNIFVDPWDVFNSVKTPFNAYKIEPSSQERFFKSAKIKEYQPSVILLGSSRVMVGINPEDVRPYLKEEETVYNGAFSGANMDEIAAYFDHALYHQPKLKKVILGLDFFNFSKNVRSPEDFSINRLQTPFFHLRDLFLITLHKSALISSYRTIRENLKEHPLRAFKSNGQYTEEFITSSHNFILSKGVYSYLKSIIAPKGPYGGYEACPKRVASFRYIVQTCREKGIELHVFICPSQAIYWETLFQGGCWPAIEALKRELCSIHSIWDFSGYNAVTTGEKETTETRFYFECSHFTPYIGKEILAHLFGGQPTLSFGKLLTPSTVDAVLQQIKGDRLEWLKGQKILLKMLQTEVFEPLSLQES